MRTSKRQGNLAIPLVVAMLVPLSGCKDSNDLTGMGQTVQTPTTVKTPTPTPPDLRGTWTGTLHSVGATDDFFCPSGGSDEVTLPIDQNGSAVTFSVASSAGRCLKGGIVQFHGTIVQGNQISGKFDVSYPANPSCTLAGGAGGTVSASAIQLEGYAGGICNAVRITIALARS